MAEGPNNKSGSGENLRPERSPSKVELTELLANQKERSELAESVEQYTESSKKAFQQPKINNSSKISEFGFTPSAKLNLNNDLVAQPGRTLQSAAVHFAELAKQEEVEREQHQVSEFRAKFGDPSLLQGGVAKTQSEPELSGDQHSLNGLSPDDRSFRVASADTSAPLIENSILRSSQQMSLVNGTSVEENALRALKAGSLYNDGLPARPKSNFDSERTEIAQAAPPKFETQEKVRAEIILAGELHGFALTVVNSISEFGNLLRMGAAAGPIGKFDIDPIGKQKLQDACSDTAAFSRIMLQLNTTLNRKSAFYGQNFAPEGREMAINFVSGLPPKFKNEIEQFKSAPLEAQSRKATELILNLGLLAGGVGEASKIGSIAKATNEVTFVSKAGPLANEKITGNFTNDMSVLSAKLKAISNDKLDSLTRYLDEKWPRIDGHKLVPEGADSGRHVASVDDNVMRMEKYSDRNKPFRRGEKSHAAKDAKESRANLESLELKKIMDEGWQKLHEAKTVKYLREKGEVITKNSKEGAYTSDAFNRRQVDGIEWELKCMSKVKDSRGIKAAIYDHAKDGSEKHLGTAQPGRVLIDAREQRYLTEALAQDGIRRAFLKNEKLKEIRIVGSGFDISLNGPKGIVKRW